MNQQTGAAVIDLCCGLGGLSFAARELGLQVLAGVDINTNALKTYGKNFPNSLAIEGSVRSKTVIQQCEDLLKASKKAGLPTLIISGPPCQGFSVAGSRDPLDPRNQILVAVARAIAKLKPDCAIVENVSMLLADKYDKRTEQFENVLADVGYQTTRLVLNAAEFGVSQKRKRAFLLITPCELKKEDLTAHLEGFKVQAKGVRNTLRGLPKPKVRPDDYSDEVKYKGVQNHFAMQHSAKVMKKIAAIEPGKGPMSYRRLHPTRLSNTLFSGHRAPPAHYSQARSITVREALRLQGFPDSFNVFGSFSNQMEQVTNAVPPPLANAVLSVLMEHTNIWVK